MARGCIVIADITGYTLYLKESELEHAQDALRNLLDVLLEHTKAPLTLSRTEGDAVISYALDGTFLLGQTIVEIIENTYVGFRRALDFIVLNTTCDCNACKNIPDLDLKFLVHDGEFVTQDLGGHVELVGSDVNLVHSLAKNHVVERTGIRAYTAYTRAAVEALGMEGFFGAMPRTVEHVEPFGEVALHVQDMAEVWERAKEEERETVTPEEALGRSEEELPLGRIEAWEYLTNPTFRAVLYDSSSSAVELAATGRQGAGMVYHCVHGRLSDTNVVVDWQPFEQYTFDTYTGVPKVRCLVTVHLHGDGDRTRVTSLCGASRGPLLLRRLSDAVTRRMFGRMMAAQFEKLRRAIDEDKRERRVKALEPEAGDVATRPA